MLVKLYPEYLRAAFYSSGVEQNQPRILQFQVFLLEFGFLHVLHWLSCDFLRFCPSGVRNCHIVQTGSKQTKNWTEFTGGTCSFEPTDPKVSPWGVQALPRAELLLLFGVGNRRAALHTQTHVVVELVNSAVQGKPKQLQELLLLLVLISSGF